jgi:hypothetical protein
VERAGHVPAVRRDEPQLTERHAQLGGRVLIGFGGGLEAPSHVGREDALE